MKSELAKLRQLTETLTSNGYLTDQTRSWKYAFDSVSDFVCITNASFRVKFINKSLLKKLELSNEEFLNKKLYYVLDESVFSIVEGKVDSLATIYYEEIYITSLNGWFERKRCSILTTSGELIGYTFMLSDVTERKLAEEALYESEIKNRALQEATFEAVFFSDKGVCIEANTSASKMFGYTYKEFIGVFGLDTIADEFKSVVKKNMASGYSKPYEVIAQRRDGSQFWAEVKGKVFNYRGKKVTVTSIIDITERKQVEKKLCEASSLLDGVLNSIPDIINIQDVNHNIIAYNKATEELFNVTSKELEGTKCYELLGRKSQCAKCQTGVSKSTKKPTRLERFIKELDGWYDCRYYPILDCDGNVAKIIAHLRDISNYKLSKKIG